MNFICGGHFTFGGRGIWWFRWYFWYFVWWLYDLGWLFGIWTDIFCVFTCAFGMLGNIFDIWIHPCLHFGCCVLFFWWFFGFLDGTFLGPNCPGPNLPLFQVGQLGPGQLGPGAQLSGAQFATFSGRTVGPRTVGPRSHFEFEVIFSWCMVCFCNLSWHLNVWVGVHWILDSAFGM